VRSHAKASFAGSIWTAAAATLILAVAILALTSASAFAALGHPVLSAFSTGDGSQPANIALDGSGNVYVLEPEKQRVVRFDPAGNPAPFSATAPYIEGNALTGTPNGAFGFLGSGTVNGLAVDRSGGPADGSIYVGGYFANPQLSIFNSTGSYKGTLDRNIVLPCGFQVDQATGQVYIVDLIGDVILRFGPAAADPAQMALEGELHASGCPMAADSTGATYFYRGGLSRFAASQFGQAEPVADPGFEPIPVAPSAVAINPADDHLFYANGSQITEVTSTGAQVGVPFGNLSTSYGLAIADNGDILASEEAGSVVVFGPSQVDLPVASTGDPSNLTPNTGEVEGSVDPDSAGGIEACEFRYWSHAGPADGSVPCSPNASSGSPITAATTVTASLSGLTAGTTYHYRIFASNGNGTQMGGDRTFTTPPAVEGVTTAAATDVGKQTATLHGSYTGNGNDTHYYFEYGTDPGYGQSTPAPPGEDNGSAAGPQEVSFPVSGLQGGTTYHFRLVASNSHGVTKGQDETLTTLPAVTNLTTGEAAHITDSMAELTGSFDSDSYDTHYYFEYGPTVAYGQRAPASPGNDVPPNSGHVDVAPVTISGLQLGGTYHYRIVATNAAGITVGADATFKTAEPPLVANLNARNVTAISAELTAEVNPRHAQTTYRFEWGPTATYGNDTPVPDAAAGEGNAPVPVSAQLNGLNAGTTYHFRFVATNQYGTTYSPDQTFGFYPPACPNAQVRQETGSNDLPDCRAYELVTPSNAQGSTIFPLNGPANTGVATSPSKLAYGAAFGTFPEETGDPMNTIGDLYISTRTDSGWYQKYIGRKGDEAVLMGGPPYAQVPSLFQNTDPTKSQFGTQVNPDMSVAIDYDQGDNSVEYGQLGEASNAPYVWDTSTGKPLGRWPTNLDQIAGGKDFVGIPKASADFSHFVFSSNVIFAPGGEEFRQKIGGERGFCFSAEECELHPSSVYDNDLKTGSVELVSVKEDGSTFRGAEIALAEDGSRILMTEGTDAKQNKPLYLRVNDERTYDIAPGREVHYAGSTADLSTIYLTSTEQLTPDDHDTSSDLYMWREGANPHLTRISAGENGEAGNSDDCATSWTTACGVKIISFTSYAEVLGGNGGNGVSDNFIASKSGDIYFETPEQLLPAKGEFGQVNIYVYRHGGVHFVAALEPKTLCLLTGQEFVYCSEGPVARMQVTPDGSHMAFVTNTHLTAYDSGEHGEMYTYDPESGRIACASCRPDGKPPVSEVLGSQNGLFQTNDGRVFFSTKDPLVPRDTDGHEDVYEYTEGKAQLITSGLNTTVPGFNAFTGNSARVGLVSVSANGTDVFFANLDPLVSQDHNGNEIRIYDARIGGGFPAERTPPHCEAADECHGAGSTAPALPPDRTSANLGRPKTRAHKHKAHSHKKHQHKKKRRKQAKGKQGQGHHKQGRSHRG